MLNEEQNQILKLRALTFLIQMMKAVTQPEV